ncbi:TlyA family RNA methyltransferase [Salisediminibacterium beveridgei]|uniref:RNA binding methyltransferase FtsJ like n=1 Tax=Salisediminibacterium beveridgei TaxID=632773 RepID=A0A1D7QUH5_9BACI|nr:TlyA family RNA methyltransferase [Salisediminibacterium beveridgei]AOM82676.1 RNA binding methyltransferase FtsJ like [Salisediminibacterium beveridgei]
MKKERIDVLLVEQGLAESRERAKRSVMAGVVLADGERIDKPGMRVSIEAILSIKGEVLPYVSRGGLKLARAIEVFHLNLSNKVMLDIGSSTGGFTDCALQQGAKHVYALDVGYNQLAWKMRQDERVTVMERTNFRYSAPGDFTGERPDFATFDVSFISIRLLMPVLKTIIVPGSDIMTLIKPQFEAGRDEVGKKGIIRDRKVHEHVIEDLVEFCETLGFTVRGIAPSPVRGGEGNIEFLMHLTADEVCQVPFDRKHIDAVVSEAHYT